MIRKLQLKNFKCFETLEIDLKNVNVFTGVNGMGKSTVIQSLLLLRQSQQFDNKGLSLNGRYINLGNSQDVVYDKATNDEIEINYIAGDKTEHRNRFLYEQDTDFLACANRIIDCEELTDNRFVYIKKQNPAVFLQGFVF